MSQLQTPRQWKALALALSVSAAMGATAAHADPASEQTIEALRAELQQMQQRLERLESEQQQTVSQSSSDQTLAQQNQAAIEEMQQVQFSGLFEFGYNYQDWSDSSKDKGGDLGFNKLILGVDGDIDQFTYSMQYRFYDGYNFLKKGWLGYNIDDANTVKAGLMQTPFGNLPYGYLGWYGNLPYLAGFNDNQNAGLMWENTTGAWDTSLAFFKADNLGGNEHYGANANGDSAQGNEEVNQLAARVAYTFGQGSDYTTEVNFSAKGGQLYNNNTNDSGSNWSAAAGVSGSYGNWLAMAQATTYKYDAENAPEDQTGISDNVIQVGAFAFDYLIPAEGEMYSASLGYSMPVSWGPVENVYFYNDFSYIAPNGDYSPYGGGFGNVDNPMFNDIGVQFTAGPYYLWMDFASQKNALGYFGAGEANKWDTQFITTFGVNF
ncbi:hypothetical protein [Kushneria aurantia]|uniref:Porin n=1 Tax=Kushneria aurantia TaxID=504092 RepID=A0ABV6G483_9GAMM|nr:hypothetical protein [Kushneria aurantia]